MYISDTTQKFDYSLQTSFGFGKLVLCCCFFFPKGYIPVSNFKDSFLSKQGRTCFPFIYH